MRHSIEPRGRRCVRGYGFLTFAKNMGAHVNKVAKKLNNKYGQKLVDAAKKSPTDALKISCKKSNSKNS